LLREIGLEILSIQDVIDVCEHLGFREINPLKQLPTPMASEKGLEAFWYAMIQVWERTAASELGQLGEQLAMCSLALGMDANIYPPSRLFQGDVEAQKLFPNVNWYKPLGHDTPIPAKLVKRFTINHGLDQLERCEREELNRLWSQDRLSIIDLYGWFEKQADQIRLDDRLRLRLRKISIWPAGGELRPLEGLYLPGRFNDP
jgi:hypothetical protein